MDNFINIFFLILGFLDWIDESELFVDYNMFLKL